MAELETTFLRYAALPVELQGLVYEACDIETRIRFNMAVRGFAKPFDHKTLLAARYLIRNAEKSLCFGVLLRFHTAR